MRWLRPIISRAPLADQRDRQADPRPLARSAGDVQAAVEHPGAVGHVAQAMVIFWRPGRQVETDAIVDHREHQPPALDATEDGDPRRARVADGVGERLAEYLDDLGASFRRNGRRGFVV